MNLFIFDFDGCITDWNDNLSFERAERIAGLMAFFLQNGFIEIISLANLSHIHLTVKQSKSKQLIQIFNNIPWTEWNTIEDRAHLFHINPSRKESITEQHKMIFNVMKSKKWFDDLECIRAYKKSNALFYISKKYNISPDHVFFFDDNMFNIIFARSNGFKAFFVNNHPVMSELNLSSHLKALKKTIQSGRRSKNRLSI